MTGREQDKTTNDLAQAMMQVRAMLEPMHEFLVGEVAYFEAQGFTPVQAHDMAAAEYCRLLLQVGGGA